MGLKIYTDFSQFSEEETQLFDKIVNNWYTVQGIKEQISLNILKKQNDLKNPRRVIFIVFI